MSKENEESPFAFEDGIKQLEAIVEKMESGELGLESSMKAFETGMTLVKKCRNQLNEVEKKIEFLSNEEGREK